MQTGGRREEMDGCRDAGVCVSSTPVLPTCGWVPWGAHPRPLSARVRHCGWTGGLVDWAVQVAIARSAYRRDVSRDFSISSARGSWSALTYALRVPLLFTVVSLSPHDRQICRLGRVINLSSSFPTSVLVSFLLVSRSWNLFLPFFTCSPSSLDLALLPRLIILPSSIQTNTPFTLLACLLLR